MYDVAKIRSEFQSLVGISQPNVPQVPLVQAPLSLSTSGIYAASKNNLIQTENLWYAAPDFNISIFDQWISGNNYAINFVVNVSNQLYKAIAAIINSTVSPATDANAQDWVSMQAYLTGNISIYLGIYYIATNNVTSATYPLSDPANWSVYVHSWIAYTPFQAWLQTKYDQASPNMMAEFVRRNKLNGMAKAVIERQQLYRGYGQQTRKIANLGNAVGFEIKPQQAEGLLVILDSFGIQLDSALDGFKLYLYHSTVNAPLQSWSNNITLVNTFVWTSFTDGGLPPALNAIMKYMAQDTSGVYYIVYYQDDLGSVQAIGKDWDCTSAPCFGCDGANVSMYNIWSQYVNIRNIMIPADAINEDRALFDTSKIIYNTITNWGLNFSITVRCDLTDTIVYSKTQFADAFAFQLCYEFLDAIAKNARINPFNSQIQTQARAELDVKFPGSWIHKYNETMDALSIDMSGFNQACLPCDNTKKMKWRGPI